MRHLPLISPESELQGSAPIAYERLCATTKPGSETHLGLFAIALGLAMDAVRMTVPPSQVAVLKAGRDSGQAFVEKKCGEKELRAARSLVFSSLSAVEAGALSALRRANEGSAGRERTPFDLHADHVVERYVSLAGYFSVAGLCHVLDGAFDPKLLLESLRDQIGARAYLRAGLGAAKSPEFRKRASEQAAFEAERTSEIPRSFDALAVQVFHEYLGARWRSLAADERNRTDVFVTWALGNRV